MRKINKVYFSEGISTISSGLNYSMKHSVLTVQVMVANRVDLVIDRVNPFLQFLS